MRSAIYYPDIEIESEAAMRAAFLMWDELKVIVPQADFVLEAKPAPLARAWELIGGTMCPDDEQKRRAHQSISELLDGELAVDVLYHDDLPDIYELYPAKLLPETWQLLVEKQAAGKQLANGDYPFHVQTGFAVMAKLADACAGTTFARWTDRFLAYGLVADRDPAAAAQTTVVPMTLGLVNPASIPIENLIALREKEKTEALGSDYRKMRHKYADTILHHVKTTADVRSENELIELRRQFKEKMRTDLNDLSEALGVNRFDTLTSPVVVSTVVTAASWLATANPMAAAVAALASAPASTVVNKVLELFRARRGYSTKQRQVMQNHPMAYVYALDRV